MEIKCEHDIVTEKIAQTILKAIIERGKAEIKIILKKDRAEIRICRGEWRVLEKTEELSIIIVDYFERK